MEEAFKCEGIQLRYRENPIYEQSKVSRAIDASINVQFPPKIFLHSDGQLYFFDHYLTEPVPLKKLKNLYTRIQSIGGELRFYDKFLKDYITLSDITQNDTINKNNSLIYTISKEASISGEKNLLEELKLAYNNIYNENINLSNDVYLQYVALSASNNTILFNFVTDWSSNLKLRSSENGSSIKDILIDNFVNGLSVQEISGYYYHATGETIQNIRYRTVETDGESTQDITGSYVQTQDSTIQGVSGYFIFNNGPQFIDNFPTTLQNMKAFFNPTKIGFSYDEQYYYGKQNFSGAKWNVFEEWLGKQLQNYNGIYSYLSAILDKKDYIDITYSFDYDDGYTTTIDSNDPYALTQISGNGYFLNTPYYPIQSKVIKNLAKGISNAIHTVIFEELFSYFYGNNLLTGVGTTYADASTLYISSLITKDSLSLDTVLGYLQNRLSILNSTIGSSLNTRISSAINNVFSLDYSTFNYSYGMKDVVRYGGICNPKESFNYNLYKMNNKWFDIEDMYVISKPLNNKKGVAIQSHFDVGIKNSNLLSTIEFRLIETTTNTILDIVQLGNTKAIKKYEIGDFYTDKYAIYPVSLTYFGSVSQFNCSSLTPETCNIDGKVGSHIRLYTSNSCADKVCLDQDEIMKDVIANLFNGTNAEIQRQVDTGLNTPRIFRVQWRIITNSSLSLPQNDDMDIFFLNKSSKTGEYRVNLSVYSLGESTGQRVIKQNTENFVNQYRKAIQFNFALPNTNYSVTLSCDQNINIWYESKSLFGFTIVAEKPFNGNVDWTVILQPSELLNNTNSNMMPVCLVNNEKEYGIKDNFELLISNGYTL